MKPILVPALMLSIFVPFIAEACEEADKLACAQATYCRHESAADGEWVKYRDRFRPSRIANVPDDNKLVLVFVEVEGNFGTQRIYTMGSFGNCFWTFENDYVSRSKVGRRILSWKRLDEAQYAE